MPYIKVSPSAMSSISETLRNSSSKVGQIESDFSRVARKLDWDVRSASDIQRQIDRIAQALEDHASMLGNMRSFMEGAERKYEAAQKEDAKLQKQYLDGVGNAVVALDKSMMTEAEKLKEREKTANTARWVTAIGCAVITISAAVVLGPLSPALILFGIGVGAIGATVNNISDQYVEDGSVDDWHSIGKDAVVGGIVGGVSSAIGLGVGNATAIGGKAAVSALSKNSVTHAISQKLTQTAAGRIGTQAVVGGISETAEGFGKDFYGTWIKTGDLDAAVGEAKDLRNRGTDFAMGAVTGAGSEVLKTVRGREITQLHDSQIREAQKKAQDFADNAVSNFNKKNISIVEAEHRAGLKNIKQAKNGVADYASSEYILRNEAGEAASFKVKMLEDPVAEKQAVKAQLESSGFKDFADAKYTLHRMADYNVATGEYTVQVVETQAKAAFDRARGPQGSGRMQYRILHGGDSRQSAAYVEPGVPSIGGDIEDLTNFIDAFADGVGDLT